MTRSPTDRAGPRTSIRRLARVLLVLLGVLLGPWLLLAPALPAQAHASLIGSDPAPDAVLDQALEQVRLDFDEPVRAATDGMRLTGPDGSSTTVAAVGTDRSVTVDLPRLTEGTQLLSWRVVSADGHPVAGVLTFSVGTPSATPPAPSAPAPGGGRSAVLLVLARTVMTAGVLLVTGMVLFEPWVLRGRDFPAGAGRVVGAAAVAGSVAALAVVPLAWLVQQGAPVRVLARPATTEQLLADPDTLAAVLTVLGLATLAGLRRSRSGPWSGLVTGLGGVLAVGSLALTGHTRTQQPTWLVVLADLTHVLAGSVWLGGVLALVLLLHPASTPAGSAVAVLRRFSHLATASVVLLAVTGTTMAVLVLDTPADLLDSGYGRALLVKQGLVVSVLVLAGWNRRVLLPALRRTGAGAAWDTLRRTLRHEAALLLAAVAVTGVLVSASPEPAGHQHGTTSGSDRAVGTPAVARADLGDGRSAELTVDPATTGRVGLTLRLRQGDGSPLVTEQPPQLRLSHPRAGIGPLTTALAPADEPGVYRGTAELPVAGRWEITVPVRVSEFEEPVVELVVTLR